jgi:hypothetical protein
MVICILIRLKQVGYLFLNFIIHLYAVISPCSHHCSLSNFIQWSSAFVSPSHSNCASWWNHSLTTDLASIGCMCNDVFQDVSSIWELGLYGRWSKIVKTRCQVSSVVFASTWDWAWSCWRRGCSVCGQTVRVKLSTFPLFCYAQWSWWLCD